jgi:hypothetical protein
MPLVGLHLGSKLEQEYAVQRGFPVTLPSYHKRSQVTCQTSIRSPPITAPVSIRQTGHLMLYRPVTVTYCLAIQKYTV